MIWIVSEMPTYCPGCGCLLFKNNTEEEKEDFNGFNAHACECDARFQKATYTEIIEAADKSGDMKYWLVRNDQT